jgi:long-chain alkane monooxygenase
MHLISFLINSPINHTILSWSDPADERLEMLGSLKRWQQLAKTYERGLFDGIFFADTPGVFDRYKERSDEAVRYGVCWPPHDPVVLLSALAAATERLGLAVTLSISANHPYQAVRSLSTLDYLSGGRIGWNIVTGHLRGEHRALGLDQLDHDARYDRADEYMDVRPTSNLESSRTPPRSTSFGIRVLTSAVTRFRPRCRRARAIQFCFRPARRGVASALHSRMPTWSSPSSRT